MSNASNKGTDHPTHPRSLISAFVIPSLEGILNDRKISIFEQVSVDKQTGLVSPSRKPRIDPYDLESSHGLHNEFKTVKGITGMPYMFMRCKIHQSVRGINTSSENILIRPFLYFAR